MGYRCISGPGGEGRKTRIVQEDEDEDDSGGQIPFIPASDSGSRLQNEFEILKYIGKGGFGDVIKVQIIQDVFAAVCEYKFTFLK